MSSSEETQGGTGKKPKTEHTDENDHVMAEIPKQGDEGGKNATATDHNKQGNSSEEAANSIEIDDDEDPPLQQQEPGTSELFPGAPCVTVAKRCKKGDDDPSPLYLNRYGPRARGWFVWSPELCHPKDSVLDVKSLQNVSEKYHRVLDYPRLQGTARMRASNVEGLYDIVWECPGLEHDPLAAAELLNPAQVKKADELTTQKARREWLAQKANPKLDKYPITHARVKFTEPVDKFFKAENGVPSLPMDSRWELGSQYKALYRKDPIKAERKVYDKAVDQAKRFLEWYKGLRPDNFDDEGHYKRATTSRDPTAQPFKQSSSSPGPQTPTPERESEQSTASSSTTAKAPVQATANDKKPSTGAPQSTDEDDEELSPEERKEQLLNVFLLKNKIKSEEAMTKKDKAKWKFFFEAFDT
jgi:hypothetical protein